jgi:hypothetical protein
MYCPKCATENGQGSKFCRQCGSNISLVPQALSGTLPDLRQNDPAAVTEYAKRIESGLKKSLIGMGFMAISIAMLIARSHDWFLFLIPAVILLGKGMSQILALRFAGYLIRPKVAESNRPETIDQAPRRLLNDPIPPSVTEHTTRNIEGPREW